MAPVSVADGASSPGQAAAMAKKRTGGRVLAVQPRIVDGKKMYRIKVLDKNGLIRYLLIKANP